MRVIAGIAKGRRLVGPKGDATRPMTDRAREALFSSLGDAVAGSRVLDLYAGTGTLGLESLSRGAASAVFVERDRHALAALRANVDAVGLGGRVAASDVEAFLATDRGTYDVVFVDPPYAVSLASLTEVLRLIEMRVAPLGMIVVHRRAGQPAPEAPDTWRAIAPRRYGDTVLFRFEKVVGE